MQFSDRIFGGSTRFLQVPAVLATIMLFRCSSLYYYPDQVEYSKPEEYGPFESLSIDVEGASLDGWYFPSAKSPTRAVVLQFHGNAQNISSHAALGVWLTQFGYDFMTYDYRGFGKSEGSPDPKRNYEDALIVLKMADDRAREKGVPLIILGQSLGGAIALRALADFDQSNVGLIIADSTFASYDSMVRNAIRNTVGSWLTFLAFFFDDEYSPIHTLDQVSRLPLLVIHSRFDPVVPFSEGRSIYENWQGRKELWALEVDGHLSWSNYGSGKTDQRLVDFLDRMLARGFHDSKRQPKVAD